MKKRNLFAKLIMAIALTSTVITSVPLQAANSTSRTFLGHVTLTTTSHFNPAFTVHGFGIAGPGWSHSASRVFREYRYTTRANVEIRSYTVMGHFISSTRQTQTFNAIRRYQQ